MPDGADARVASAKAELPPFNFEIRTLSNRADLLSDGDALVEVQVPKTVPMKKVTLTLNGVDVGDRFVADEDTRTLRGVLTGMAPGENTFVADANGNGNGRPWASLTLTNHVRGGPILLGSQTQPWICATPTPVPASGNTPASNASGLSTFALDAKCNIATEYKLFYRTTTPGCSNALPDPSPPAAPPANNCFKPYTPGTTPADLATTTTTNGLTVPYIVRVERGTMNRGIYDIAVLFDPAKPWTALAPQAQWNGKVVYTFGASTGQPRLQFRTEQNWADDQALSRGFMVVDNSLTDSLYNSNRTLVAETTMMMKEHIVDAYGEVRFVMGNGCSGGSIQQNTVASIYPGLLDGIQPSCDYPDSITTGLEVTDCVLLVNFYASADWLALQGGLTQAQINAKKTAINGHLDQRGCQSWNNSFGFNGKPGNYVPTLVIDQNTGAMAPVGAPRNNCLLPAALVYDPVTNPNGTRCGDADLSTAVWGTTAGIPPGSVRARTTLDNVGVQYGLKALLSGAISAEEFVTLNEKIGGFDADGNRTAARTVADAAGAADRVPRGHRVERREPGQAADHRLARLRRAGHPLHLALVLRACAHRRRVRRSRQPGDVALRHRPAARDGGAGGGRDGEVVPHHGRVAQQLGGDGAQGDAQRRAHARASRRGQAPCGARLLLPDGRPELHHAGHRHGAVRRRPAPAEARFPAPGGRRSARGEHPQVPAQAAEPVRLCAGCLHGRAVDTPERCVPWRRVRLEQARRRPAGSDLAAHLRGRSGRRAAPAGTHGAEPAALGSVAEPGTRPRCVPGSGDRPS